MQICKGHEAISLRNPCADLRFGDVIFRIFHEMELSNIEARELFRLLGEKANNPQDGKGFQEMADVVGEEVSKRFLYDKYQEMDRGEEVISFRNSKIEPMLDAIGFDGILSFRRFLESPIPETLQNCCGSWILFLRQNSKEGLVYQSPVEIHVDQQKVWAKLRGPSHQYHGEVIFRNGCIVVLFTNGEKKQFHHVYKVGDRKEPEILQGIYSGISIGNDPIGGRSILWRSSKSFDTIPNKQLRIEELLISEDSFEQAVGAFFESFERNNLRVNPIVSFGSEDLRNP